MANLVEQRNAYVARLQELIDARQHEIDEKVRVYREELEKDKLTPEMQTLVQFVRQIDTMIAYDKDNAIAPVASAQEDAEVEEIINDESKDCGSAEVNVEDEAKSEEHINESAHNAAETLVGTSYEAIASDLADTRAKLQAVNAGRSGMAGVILPRR